MTIGTWDPSPEKTDAAPYQIKMEFLKKIIHFMDQKESKEGNESHDINTYLNAEEQETHCPIMTLTKDDWFAIKEFLDDSDIIRLIKFFTLAEMAFPKWSADASSPVIWLTKILRQKGKRIEPDLLQWIKSNNNNKFLPYGAL